MLQQSTSFHQAKGCKVGGIQIASIHYILNIQLGHKTTGILITLNRKENFCMVDAVKTRKPNTLTSRRKTKFKRCERMLWRILLFRSNKCRASKAKKFHQATIFIFSFFFGGRRAQSVENLIIFITSFSSDSSETPKEYS